MKRLQHIIDIATDPQGPNALVTIATLAKKILLEAPKPPSRAALDCIAERQRQLDVECWSTEHDDGHVNDEIAALACFYAMPPGAREWPATETGYGSTVGEAIVPEGWEPKAGERRQELVKAGALIFAEIERLDRAAALEADPTARRSLS